MYTPTKSRLKHVVINVISGVVVIVLLWQGVVFLFHVPDFILPTPMQVAQSLEGNFYLILDNLWITVLEIIYAFLLAVSMGISIGIAMNYSRMLASVVRPVIIISQVVPVFVLAPLITLWFGFQMTPKIIMAFLITFFPVASATFDGINSVDTNLLHMAKLMQTTKMRLLLLIRLPYALPSIASGIRVAAVFAPIGAVIGEWVGAGQGIGFLLLTANARFNATLLFATLFVFVVFSLAFFFSVDALLNLLMRKLKLLQYNKGFISP